MTKEFILKKYEARPTVTHLYCDCGAKMEETDTQYLAHPPLFEYQCPMCEQGCVSRTRYPITTMEPIGHPEERLVNEQEV